MPPPAGGGMAGYQFGVVRALIELDLLPPVPGLGPGLGAGEGVVLDL